MGFLKSIKKIKNKKATTNVNKPKPVVEDVPTNVMQDEEKPAEETADE
eukprot:CAMPEP_0195524780 /NCGR_PEP_ID=MMETSP0794_2-20130614/24819_1 /TAXON_ID=515487 /ORGANISM="Stephanopyxis turris, Strain CCMP 815" /LENGTH=47 /DNA_ID= /DNA_START= /DNA_END= /DNA_ORIENTATION=